MPNKVLLAEPRGFCAGVEMAIKALTWMVKVFEPPVYCYHEIVHNAAVVAAFEDAGVVFVDDIRDVPEGRPVMLSAHGSAPEVVAEASQRAAVMVDAIVRNHGGVIECDSEVDKGTEFRIFFPALVQERIPSRFCGTTQNVIRLNIRDLTGRAT